MANKLIPHAPLAGRASQSDRTLYDVYLDRQIDPLNHLLPDLQNHGCMDVPDLPEDDLDTKEADLHPILQFSNFDGITKREYRQLASALQLANKFLTEDAMLGWWARTKFGVATVHKKSGKTYLRKGPEEADRDSVLRDVKKTLRELAEGADFVFQEPETWWRERGEDNTDGECVPIPMRPDIPENITDGAPNSITTGANNAQHESMGLTVQLNKFEKELTSFQENLRQHRDELDRQKYEWDDLMERLGRVKARLDNLGDPKAEPITEHNPGSKSNNTNDDDWIDYSSTTLKSNHPSEPSPPTTTTTSPYGPNTKWRYEIQINPLYRAYLTKLATGYDPSPSALQRLDFFLATLLTHELAHAFWKHCRGNITEPYHSLHELVSDIHPSKKNTSIGPELGWSWAKWAVGTQVALLHHPGDMYILGKSITSFLRQDLPTGYEMGMVHNPGWGKGHGANCDVCVENLGRLPLLTTHSSDGGFSRRIACPTRVRSAGRDERWAASRGLPGMLQRRKCKRGSYAKRVFQDRRARVMPCERDLGHEDIWVFVTSEWVGSWFLEETWERIREEGRKKWHMRLQGRGMRVGVAYREVLGLPGWEVRPWKGTEGGENAKG
ncbi:hypothetical protein BU16DRAFT_559005 [Lophium mytilinum]|uniref:Uncharacterized protein n=1 Tax=Lophium mytilinum TaxID=390894 RepID=A0A6A6R4U3_9PEZI|nr:hypothetical protein BU16DRAFT_559005 [Lophium mytilinum]